jgi:hypothetical protein
LIWQGHTSTDRISLCPHSLSVCSVTVLEMPCHDHRLMTTVR